MVDQIMNEGTEEDKLITKVERKQQRRAERQRARESDARRQQTKRGLVWGLVVVGLAGIVWYAIDAGREQVGETGQTILEGQIRADDWVKGKIEAKVVLIEYADFQCPACASYAEIVKRLNDNYGDRVAFVYRQFPLKQIHRNAEAAAYAAEAAGEQGKFWEMHDILYERQADWSDVGRAETMFTDYARTISLDVERWQAEMTSTEVREKVANSYTEAIRLGLQATPSFILNGKKIEARSYEQFEQLIKRDLGE